MEQQFRNKEIPSLNGWRAIAVALVVGNHVAEGYIAIPGGLGVTIFFFLSGFLITRLLINEFIEKETINIKHFFLRRLFRIGPPLVIVLVFAYTLTSAGFLRGSASWRGFIAQLFYFSNYYTIFFGPDNLVPSGTAVYWSLAVEEHFYLIYPAVILLMLRYCRRENIPRYLIAACAVVLCWRYALATTPGFNPDRTYYATDTRIDSILFGCIFSFYWAALENNWLFFERSEIKLPLVIAGSTVLIAVLAVRGQLFRETIRYTLQGLALMPLFLYSIKSEGSYVYRFLNSSIMNRLGIYSYSIYLSHEIIFDNIYLRFNSIIAAAGLTLVLSLAVAYCMEVLIDSKFRRLRARFR